MMRVVAGQMPELTDEFCQFAAQLGLGGVQVNTPRLPGDERWEVDDLVVLRRKAEKHGLRLEAIENIPISFYDDVMMGGPRAEKQIANVQAVIRHVAAAEIPVLGYCFMPQSVWRTSVDASGRAGAIVTTYDHEIAEDPARRDDIWVARRDDRLESVWVRGKATDVGSSTPQEMWKRHLQFVEAILPVAEAEGIRLALHPDDPPVSSLAGVGRAISSVDALKLLADHFTSPAFGFDLCLGTVSEMGGADAVMESVRYLGARDKIIYVHMRDVIGTVPRFSECFIGEGNYDPLDVVRELHGLGFDGFVMDDHVPEVVDDSPWMHRGRAHAIGYLQALIHAVSHEANGRVRS